MLRMSLEFYNNVVVGSPYNDLNVVAFTDFLTRIEAAHRNATLLLSVFP